MALHQGIEGLGFAPQDLLNELFVVHPD